MAQAACLWQQFKFACFDSLKESGIHLGIQYSGLATISYGCSETQISFTCRHRCVRQLGQVVATNAMQ